MARAARWLAAALATVLGCAGAAAASPAYSLREALTRESSLSLVPVVHEGLSVTIDGYDGRRPGTPFTFDWGDGMREESFFVAEHTYAEGTGVARITVTAHYDDGTTGEAGATLPLRPAVTYQRRVPRAVALLLPDSPATVAPAVEPGGPRLGAFPAEVFTAIPPDAIEYVLDVAHAIQIDLCNGDVAPRARTRQVVARSEEGYGCSLWFLEPATVACATKMVGPSPDWSSLFHEMGHNVTLNTPAACHLGGKTDGPMSAIASESLAQILQHATAALLCADAERTGLSPDLRDLIWACALRTTVPLVEGARRYEREGMCFRSRDLPETPTDETLPSFMHLGREFLLLADETGEIRLATKRLMAAVETWSPADTERWQQPENEVFRATFLVAAMSHGVGRDLREHFRARGYPVDDTLYGELAIRPKAEVR